MEKIEESIIPDIQEVQGWTFDIEKDEYLLSPESIKETFPMKTQAKRTFSSISIPNKLFCRLYEHQRVGIQWLSSLYWSKVGGILGDDMGMVSNCLFEYHHIKNTD